MASFVKLFKRKTSKQNSLSHPFNSAEVPFESAINAMHDGKSFRVSSLRINRKTHAKPKQCDCENGTNENCIKTMEYSHNKSPYSVFTEPKKGRSTRSCPVGPSNNKETNNRKFRKFSPPFCVQATIHERSGSYENLTTSQLEHFWEEKRKERGKERVGEAEKRRKNDENGQKEKPQQKREQQKQREVTVTHGMGGELAKRCHAGHLTAHCSRHHHPQQQLSTSEYWSADPSPIEENQHHLRHFRISQEPTNGMGRENTMELIGLEVGKDEESSSEDADSSSDDQEISHDALLQFWQQQVRMLKRELKSSRETAEKYRSKYLRLKSKTDEMNSELTREKERNIWLFNQLISTNEKMTQLNWAQLHFRDSQRQQNMLTMNTTTEVVDNELQLSQNYHFDLHMKDDERLENGKKLENNVQHRSAAGEVQAELSSDDFDDKSAVLRERICCVGTENGHHTMDQQQQKQPKLMRTPTPVPMANANGATNDGLLMGNFLYAPGTPFLNFNLFQNPQHIQNQLHVEVARGSHLMNTSLNSNTRMISPPMKKGARKADKDNSPMVIEEDEKEEQLEHAEEEGDSESLIDIDPEEHGPIVIPLDAFCHQQTEGVKLRLRHCRSSEDLRSFEKGTIVGSTMASSSEDDIRMWKKQLRSRGDRVLFRPSRKSLFSGVIGDQKGPNKIFRRFGQHEREALARFDYLRDEHTDLSGLMSSPEKMVETKID